MRKYKKSHLPSGDFIENTMLAVTEVNGCKVCFVHAYKNIEQIKKVIRGGSDDHSIAGGNLLVQKDGRRTEDLQGKSP